MNLFITANNTDMGKTYTALKLIESLSKEFRVGVFKPIETGVKEYPVDGKKLLETVQKVNPEFNNITLEDIVPIQFELPAAPAVCGDVDFEKIDKAYNKLKKRCDILLIEGAGGIAVPVTNNFIMKDFIDYFNAKSLLVIGGKLGCINDLALNLNFFTPDIWAINLIEENFFTTTYPYLKQKYKEVLIIQNNLDKIIKKIKEVNDRK
jgi:dethiobiotin synthetase